MAAANSQDEPDSPVGRVLSGAIRASVQLRVHDAMKSELTSIGDGLRNPLIANLEHQLSRSRWPGQWHS